MPEPIAWIDKLDDIESPTSIKPFGSSFIGRLPTELLQLVASFLSEGSLVNVALVATQLRAIAERELYHFLEFSDPEEDHTNGLAFLYRTLAQRPDLSKMVKRMYLHADQSHILQFPVPSSNIFVTGLSFLEVTAVEVTEGAMAGTLFRSLPELERLDFSYEFKPDYSDPANPTCMSTIFPGFNDQTSHKTELGAFQKLKTLAWYASDFHWILAKSACLKELRIERTCKILEDTAPEEKANQLKRFLYTSRSSILGGRYDTLSAFLGHFPGLDELQIDIDDMLDDDSWDSQDLSAQHQGCISSLLEKLAPVAPIITRLIIGTQLFEEIQENPWLSHLLPGGDLTVFHRLLHLHVPHQCLFGSFEPQGFHISTYPAELLPSTLEELEVTYPKTSILDFLAKLAFCRKELPALRKVRLICGNDHGDPYNDFAFELHDHTVWGTLKPIGIKLTVEYRKQDWQEWWDSYDLKSLDLAAWQMSFGPPITSTCSNTRSFGILYEY